MVEWFKAAVLKTAVAQVTEGSNPSLSAIFSEKNQSGKDFLYRIFSSITHTVKRFYKNIKSVKDFTSEQKISRF